MSVVCISKKKKKKKTTTKTITYILCHQKIKALTALVGRLSLSVDWENGPERKLKTVSFTP